MGDIVADSGEDTLGRAPDDERSNEDLAADMWASFRELKRRFDATENPNPWIGLELDDAERSLRIVFGPILDVSEERQSGR